MLTEEQYQTRYDELCDQYRATESKMQGLINERQKRENNAIAIGDMIFEFREIERLPIDFNEKLWSVATERVVGLNRQRTCVSF